MLVSACVLPRPVDDDAGDEGTGDTHDGDDGVVAECAGNGGVLVGDFLGEVKGEEGVEEGVSESNETVISNALALDTCAKRDGKRLRPKHHGDGGVDSEASGVEERGEVGEGRLGDDSLEDFEHGWGFVAGGLDLLELLESQADSPAILLRDPLQNLRIT